MRLTPMLLVAVCVLACDSSSSGTPGSPGASGNAGTNNGGSAGTTATGGAAGTSTGGSAGTSSSAGTGGSTAAGTGGSATAGTGGSVTAGNAGAAGNASCPAKLDVPSVPDSCTKDTDCVLATSLKGCCGPTAYAVPTASLATWNTAAETYNACSCPVPTSCFADATRAEDNTTPGETPPVARCLQGTCVASYVASCAAPPVAKDRACEKAQDCAARVIDVTCCSNKAFGVRADAAGIFTTAWSQYNNACRGQCLTGCFAPPPTADDGTVAATAEQQPTVQCVEKVCTATFAK